jgi:hypothetical protein
VILVPAPLVLEPASRSADKLMGKKRLAVGGWRLAVGQRLSFLGVGRRPKENYQEHRG